MYHVASQFAGAIHLYVPLTTYLVDLNVLVRSVSVEEIEKLRKELEELKRMIKAGLTRKVEGEVSEGGIYIRVSRDVLEEAAPETVVSRDLLRFIRDSIRRSLRERGEMAIEEMILGLPEEEAAKIVKSIASSERIRILKLLYTSPKNFSDLKRSTGLESSSLSHHLKVLTRVGLVRTHLRSGGYALTSRGRFLLRLLAFMYEAVGGVEVE